MLDGCGLESTVEGNSVNLPVWKAFFARRAQEDEGEET